MEVPRYRDVPPVSLRIRGKIFIFKLVYAGWYTLDLEIQRTNGEISGRIIVRIFAEGLLPGLELSQFIVMNYKRMIKITPLETPQELGAGGQGQIPTTVGQLSVDNKTNLKALTSLAVRPTIVTNELT